GADTGRGLPPIDRTPKMYVGGAQVRPDAPYVLPVVGEGGRLVGEVGRGNRKDIRNAVEAARKAEGWTHTTGHNRAQVLFYIAENLAAREAQVADRLAHGTGSGKRQSGKQQGRREVEATLARLFHWAAW